MNRQEIFDKVATHLLTQKVKSMDGENGFTCLYRGANGTKCAVGCLIPDEEYHSTLEMAISALLTVPQLLKDRPVLTSLIPHAEFLSALQRVHDAHNPPDWKDELSLVGDKYSLDASVLNNF